MKVWKKQTVRWSKKGKSVPANTPGATKKRVLSTRYYGTLKTSTGKSKQVPLSENIATSERILRTLQDEEERKQILGISEDDIKESKPEAVPQAVMQYVDSLTVKGNSSEYIQLCQRRLTKVLSALSMKSLSDIKCKPIVLLLSRWHKNQNVSLQTCTHYVRVLKQFVHFLIREGIIKENPLIGLKSYNAKLDRRHVRRALTLLEFTSLLKATSQSDKRCLGDDWQFLPVDRVMLYRVAVSTGLRAKELSLLRIADIDLCHYSLTVPASISKNNQEATLPLSSSLCELLTDYLKEKRKQKLLFPGSWAKNKMAGRLFKRDLKLAGIEKVDAKGRVLDFHSLRYTFITNLARAEVHPSIAQKLARHSSIELTMNIYTQLDVEDLRGAVEKLPDV